MEQDERIQIGSAFFFSCFGVSQLVLVGTWRITTKEAENKYLTESSNSQKFTLQLLMKLYNKR